MWNIFPSPKEIGCIAIFLFGVGLVIGNLILAKFIR